MDSKGGNPFLMDDYPSATTTAAASNPFLDFGEPSTANTVNPMPAGADANPFFDFGGGSGGDQTSYQPPTDSTNPFASFGVAEESATVPEPETSVFVTPEVASVPPSLVTTDLVNVEPEITTDDASVLATDAVIASNQSTMVPSKPARPPPPPRPGPPPPPRNTKDLILSVTGAMDETSNQMLDRLQATRTPSPTLMHSPSPTPEHSFADMLDVDGGVPDLVHDANESTEAAAPVDTGGEIHDETIISYEESSQMQQIALVNATPRQSVGAVDTIGLAEKIKNPMPRPPPPPVVPRATGQVTENPFSDSVGQSSIVEQQTFDQQKRPSLTTAYHESGVAEETIVTEPVAQSMASNLFGDVSTAPSSSIDASSFFSTASQQQPTSPAFADLLGDLGTTAPTQEAADFSTVPTEFPSATYSATTTTTTKPVTTTNDAFDAFASKFDKAGEHDNTSSGDPFNDPFAGAGGQTAMDTSSDVWGDSTGFSDGGPVSGFDDTDDAFLSMTAPPPNVLSRRRDSADSDEAPDFSVVIKPREGDNVAYQEGGPVPVLAPPPKSPMATAYSDNTPRFNPFDKSAEFAQDALVLEGTYPEMKRSDSQETPPTPLFDEDMSQPLEDFPRVPYKGEGWEMQLRFPIKKKITGQRFWKKVWVKLVYQGDNPVVQLYNAKGDKDPFQELPLLACYSVSEIAAQQFDQYGKIFTVKLQYIIYKERPGVRPGQVTKAERITNKLSQFAAYAIQGDYQGVKEFGSDLKKLGLPFEHAPTSSQLFKFGSQNYEDMKTFSVAIEEALFKLPAHRDRALQYKMEEVQISVVDEVYVEQNVDGHVDKQIARVRLFFLGFLSGMPDVELGINDIWRQGKEVVGRHDIIPVATEEWIRLEDIEFHSCIQQDEHEKTRIIKFKPPDACYIELIRFRVRPPRNRELPLQLKAVMCVTGNKVELRADILIPGFASRKLGLVPCEDVMVRFPIPECWIYLFRVEKHFRYGSVKSAHRRTGKIKGIERFLGAVDTLEPQLMEVTSGQAKYEHHHHSIVWRMPRLPKEGQGSYTTHNLVCRMNLTSYDQIPEKLTEYAYVEFTMPATQVSHTTARSVSFQNFDSDDPPEKYVKNLSRHEYRVEIEHTQGEGPGAYISATTLSTPKKTAIPESTAEETPAPGHAPSDSDSSD